MHYVYVDYWNTWVANGGDMMNQYVNVEAWGIWGLWGTLEYVNQDIATSPKYMGLLQFIGQHPMTP